MRNRFFFIILTTLVLGAVGITWIELHFFEQQRVELIDQQISKSAETLVASSEFRKSAENVGTLEDTISQVIGSERIGKVFILREGNGRLIYQSENMSVLQTELPTSPEWVTVQAKDQYVRLYNSRLGSSKILQVGLVLDHNFVNWNIFNADVAFLITLLLVTVFLIAAVLTIILLSPIRLLNAHLVGATADLSNLKDVDPLPSTLLKFSSGFWSRSDEFASLVSTMGKLIGRINQNYKLTRSWTFQMAHELKTPLAIMRAETESARSAKVIPEKFAETLLGEIDWTSDTVTQFLTWAELENSSPQRTLHVSKLGNVVRSGCDRLAPLCRQTIDLRVESDFSVVASAGHLDQLVTNILGNACKFSPPESTISILVDGGVLTIEDSGSGIPNEVLERIGEPFNVGSNKPSRKMKGNGLGLAWIKTVSKLYGWHLVIDSRPGRTRVSIEFPLVD